MKKLNRKIVYINYPHKGGRQAGGTIPVRHGTHKYCPEHGFTELTMYRHGNN